MTLKSVIMVVGLQPANNQKKSSIKILYIPLSYKVNFIVTMCSSLTKYKTNN